ncbi:hypothetical protein BDW59DRAFT_148720 [Aspergillus cavernicola]|uniref:Uncharacterized protein n=1 Tax=Aspergillus cavernicola TaxID=176166 RepID=A0ABR4I6F2_9EURO
MLRYSFNISKRIRQPVSMRSIIQNEPLLLFTCLIVRMQGTIEPIIITPPITV